MSLLIKYSRVNDIIVAMAKTAVNLLVNFIGNQAFDDAIVRNHSDGSGNAHVWVAVLLTFVVQRVILCATAIFYRQKLTIAFGVVTCLFAGT
jgi:hypothetical protein